MNGKALDALDRTIIDLLSKDGRISNRQIAAELGVTEGTIRARLKRLQQENLIRFTAVIDYRLAGSPKLVLMGIHADPSAVGALAEQISAMVEIGCVIIMLGRYSLLAMGLFTRLEDSIEIANNRILSLPGVQHVETSVAVQTPKYDFRMAMIT